MTGNIQDQDVSPPRQDGYPYNPEDTPALRSPSETASPFIALACGVTSFTGLGLLTAIPAIIFGRKGRREADQGRNHSRGMATAGMWLGTGSVILHGLVVLAVMTIVGFGVVQDLRFNADNPVTDGGLPAVSQEGTPVDISLRDDVQNMAQLQETYMTDNPDKGTGFSVAATAPGGNANVAGNAYHGSNGNVITVKIEPGGYCIAAYNPSATDAISKAAAMVFKASDGIQDSVGTC